MFCFLCSTEVLHKNTAPNDCLCMRLAFSLPGLRALDSHISGLALRSPAALVGNLSSFRLMYGNGEIHSDVLKTVVQDLWVP